MTEDIHYCARCGHYPEEHITVTDGDDYCEACLLTQNPNHRYKEHK